MPFYLQYIRQLNLESIRSCLPEQVHKSHYINLFPEASSASGALLHSLTVCPLIGSFGHNRQGVDTSLEFLRQQIIDHPVPGDQLGVPELLAHHDHLEMGLGSLGNVVHIGLIDNLYVDWGQVLGYF